MSYGVGSNDDLASLRSDGSSYFQYHGDVEDDGTISVGTHKIVSASTAIGNLGVDLERAVSGSLMGQGVSAPPGYADEEEEALFRRFYDFDEDSDANTLFSRITAASSTMMVSDAQDKLDKLFLTSPRTIVDARTEPGNKSTVKIENAPREAERSDHPDELELGQLMTTRAPPDEYNGTGMKCGLRQLYDCTASTGMSELEVSCSPTPGYSCSAVDFGKTAKDIFEELAKSHSGDVESSSQSCMASEMRNSFSADFMDRSFVSCSGGKSTRNSAIKLSTPSEVDMGRGKSRISDVSTIMSAGSIHSLSLHHDDASFGHRYRSRNSQGDTFAPEEFLEVVAEDLEVDRPNRFSRLFVMPRCLDRTLNVTPQNASRAGGSTPKSKSKSKSMLSKLVPRKRKPPSSQKKQTSADSEWAREEDKTAKAVITVTSMRSSRPQTMQTTPTSYKLPVEFNGLDNDKRYVHVESTPLASRNEAGSDLTDGVARSFKSASIGNDVGGETTLSSKNSTKNILGERPLQGYVRNDYRDVEGENVDTNGKFHRNENRDDERENTDTNGSFRFNDGPSTLDVTDAEWNPKRFRISVVTKES